MVTDTRTTIPTDRTTRTTIVDRERTDTTNQAALWIVLAIIAFAGLGYAFYHYSNPVNGTAATATSSDQTPAVNDNNTSNATTNSNNGTVMNNDTSTTPNTGTPAATSTTPSDAPAGSATTTPSTNAQ